MVCLMTWSTGAATKSVNRALSRLDRTVPYAPTQRQSAFRQFGEEIYRDDFFIKDAVNHVIKIGRRSDEPEDRVRDCQTQVWSR